VPGSVIAARTGGASRRWARHDPKVNRSSSSSGDSHRRDPAPSFTCGETATLQGVDEVGVEELPDGGRPTTEPDILALRGVAGPLQDCALEQIGPR
jgi:hypothetical protein